MKLGDEKIIEFLYKSPVKSFATMLDVFRYVDGNWIHADVEYELLDDALGDNLEGKVKIRVPNIRGITANALLKFAWHAMDFNLIRRRTRTPKPMPEPPGRTVIYEDVPEMIVFYELTPSGSYMVKVLEVLTDVSELEMPAVGGA
jgi:hypothetical protein